MGYRKLINPAFSPKEIDALEPSLRATAVELIEGLQGQGGCDFVKSFARELPIIAFLRLMGLPLEEISTFREWDDEMMHSDDLAIRSRAARNVKAYLLNLIEERRARPTDGTNLRNSGSDLRLPHSSAFYLLLFFFFLIIRRPPRSTPFPTRRSSDLAENPQLQSRLREHPEEIPEACEEFLRAFGVVVTSRYLTRDAEFHGVAMKKGDRVVTPLGVGSRDPRVHEHPDVIDFDRFSTRNITFGAGPHRCVGSHLARREIQLSIEEWLKRIPEFRIAPDGKPLANVVTVWGLDYLNLEW